MVKHRNRAKSYKKYSAKQYRLRKQQQRNEEQLIGVLLIIGVAGLIGYKFMTELQIQVILLPVLKLVFGMVLLAGVCFLLFKIISVLLRRWITKQKRMSLLNATQHVGYINVMDPRQAEECVAGIFNKLGYDAKLTPIGADDGIDGFLKKDGLTFALQVKRYLPNNTVGAQAVRNFRGSYADDPNITGGFFVTTSSYTEPAKQWAHGRNITLWDARDLAEKLDVINS